MNGLDGGAGSVRGGDATRDGLGLFSEALRAQRVRAGLTQQEVARRAGVSVRTVRYIEQGKVDSPRCESVRRLAGAVGLELVGDAPASAADAPGAGESGGYGPVGQRARRLEVGVLGPLTVGRGGRPVDAGPLQQRSLLALLALHANRVVGREEIIGVLWGDRLPASPVASVHTYVARLRRIVEPERRRRAQARVIVASGEGYLLAVEDEQVDLVRFDGLLSQAGRARRDHPEKALELLDRALGCWRGPVVTDMPARVREHPAAAAVAQRRLAAALSYADLAIGQGRYGQAIDRLRPLAYQEPLHEGVHARLMLALAGAGQPAVALQDFASLRTRLADELGVEPGAELKDAYLRVLRQNLSATPAPSPLATAPVVLDRGRVRVEPEPGGRDAVFVRSLPCLPAPAQLPPDIADFTGRERQLVLLSQALDGGRGTRERPRAVPVLAITGMAGVGKSALAVHAAHGVADAFPDGQLYADLQGTGGVPADPAVVLGCFLRALAIGASEVPRSSEERAALYRTCLAGRRVLVLLDDAAAERQVRPLLPGTPGSAVLVTSRHRLTGLEGADLLDLDVPRPTEAVELLARVAGVHRVAAEPESAAEIVRLCGGIPLAVRIAGARLANRPRWPLAHLAALLHDERRRLDELAVGDLAVRAGFEADYVRLDEDVRLTFRLLGLVTVPSIASWMVAELLGVPLADAQEHIETLLDARLLATAEAGATGQLRYRMPELVRLFAAERARAEGDRTGRAVMHEHALGTWLRMSCRMPA